MGGAKVKDLMYYKIHYDIDLLNDLIWIYYLVLYVWVFRI